MNVPALFTNDRMEKNGIANAREELPSDLENAILIESCFRRGMLIHI